MRLLIALMVVVGMVEAQDKICQDCSCQKSRAEKKALLQEASKRSAGYEIGGGNDVITDWFIKNWEEYCAQVMKDTVWVMAKEPKMWTDGKFIREDWFVRGTRTPTFEGFIDYLKRRKK